jgi:hypothetical protein
LVLCVAGLKAKELCRLNDAVLLSICVSTSPTPSGVFDSKGVAMA